MLKVSLEEAREKRGKAIQKVFDQFEDVCLERNASGQLLVSCLLKQICSCAVVD